MPNVILVVEDEPDLLLVISERLKIAGYDVITAVNGRLAIEQIKIKNPDLIITDVVMPELDGFGLLKELKKNPATAFIPIIILTARGKMSDTFNSMGAADFLIKPFDDKILLATVSKHLSANKAVLIPAIKAPNPKPEATSKKALVTGTDMPTMQNMAKQLGEKGYFVEVVIDCLQIFTKVQELQPQLLIMEIPLTDVMAKDVIKIVRELDQCDTIPILLYSFYQETEGGTDDLREKALSIDTAKEECLENGATQYIGSYNEKTFISAINKFL